MEVSRCRHLTEVGIDERKSLREPGLLHLLSSGQRFLLFATHLPSVVHRLLPDLFLSYLAHGFTRGGSGLTGAIRGLLPGCLHW